MSASVFICNKYGRTLMKMAYVGLNYLHEPSLSYWLRRDMSRSRVVDKENEPEAL